jgi:O-antigen/teichoic acid export membrane protein
MNTRKLLSNAVVYGFADVVVLLVGGFLLLPLYTRTLSQDEYGIYVIIRANIEIFTYVLYFGLPSAVSRVYFIYKDKNEHFAYLSSILMFFLLTSAVTGIVLLLEGYRIWAWLSPTAPAEPYLYFTVAIAAVGFLPAIGTMWLRLDGRAYAFATVQICTAVILAVCVCFSLLVLHMGLRGLMAGLLISAGCSALILPVLFKNRFRPLINWSHIRLSLKFAVPILIGYIAYFVMNRISTLILQRYVPLAEMAVYGLGQQLAMIATMASTAFGAAMQPALFAAGADKITDILRRSANVLLVLVMAVSTVLIMFSAEIFAVIAPRGFTGGSEIMSIMLIANFINSFNLITNSALLYFHHPKTATAVSIAGAVAASLLGAWLIPRYHLPGAAISSLLAVVAMSLLGRALSRRVSGFSGFLPMFVSTGLMIVVALGAWALTSIGLTMPITLALKTGCSFAVFALSYYVYFKRSFI